MLDDYDEYLVEKAEALREHDTERLNQPRKSDGRAPADFVYDPLSKKGFE